VKEGKEENPIGYCHFTQQHDDKFFKQLTAESLVTRSRGGRSVTEWVMSRENHYLDCRVINLVCAERMRIGSMSILDWQKLSDIRDCPPEDIQGSLLSLQAQLTSTPTASVPPTKPTEMPNTENQTKRMSKRKKLKPKR
jgi:phage terminase large subunit GpA-like protein